MEARGQDPLQLIDQETQVRSVSFRFLGSHAFGGDQLLEQVLTKGPTLSDRLKKRFAFLPLVSAPAHPFNPVELQRDMARLRRFYARNGFLKPTIDYPATQFRRSSNRIRVIINVDEGPPLSVVSRDVQVGTFPVRFASDWENLLERAPLAEGRRYTEFDRLQLESRVRSFWRDRGYAFADVSSDLRIDSSASVVDLRLVTTLGPMARIDSIAIEGNQSVGDDVVLRELPFRVGDTFGADLLVKGQRSLFSLNLFRVALVEVPEQAVDSLVTVRVRLREAQPRFIEATTGYSREDGSVVGATWRHRNFIGGARQFSVSANAQTGLFANPPAGRLSIRDYTSTISIGQPYVLVRDVSAQLSLGGRRLIDPNLDTSYRKASVTPSLLYEILPFRSISLQYAFSQAEPLNSETSLGELGIFSQDVLAATFTVGWLNNYLNPRRGWIIRPSLERAGTLLTQDVAYSKGTLDASFYIPITRRSSVALSLTAGRLHPTGPSRDQTDPETEFRFDDIRFYAGGSSDVRGWGLNALGPQLARADSVVVAPDGSFSVTNARYEAIGGLGKLKGSVEFVFPAPLLGPSWKAATFVDFGGVSARLIRTEAGMVQTDENDQPVFEDVGFPRASDLQFSGGAGLRLSTPVGAIRLDLAYKLNPSRHDLHTPEDEVLYNLGLTDYPADRRWNRLNFHISIQRAF